jgi:hypothetical protein
MFCAIEREVHHRDHGEHGEKLKQLLSVPCVFSVVRKEKRTHREPRRNITKAHKTSHFEKTQTNPPFYTSTGQSIVCGRS